MPGDGKAVPWHQDASYWPLSPSKAVTVWLAIDDADRDNACMRVIPGTHHFGHLTYRMTEDADQRAQLEARGLAEPLARIEKAITTPAVWGARPEAAPADVLMTWNQLVALHRQWHSLIKELKDAELALGQDASEANYSWLRDVKTRLSVIDGTEALVEGFGASSGRAAPSF